MSDNLYSNQKSVTGTSFPTEVPHIKEILDNTVEGTRNCQISTKKGSSGPKVKKEKNNNDDSSEEESKEDEAKNVIESGTGIKLLSESGPKKPPICNSGDRDNGNDRGNSNGNDGEKGTKIAKKVGWFALKTAAISVGILGGTALIVPALGFGTLGVTGGSLAAMYQSSVLGGTIASGSAFATLQSIGMAGLSAATQGAVVAGSAATSGAHSIYKMIKEKSKK